MKKIIFFKLWKYGTCCKVKGVHFQNKRFGRVYMNQKWGSCEKGFQRLKCIFNFNSLGKRLILPSQMSERGDNRGVVCNELLIKINEPKETLNIPNNNQGNPIHNGLALTKVHMNAISKNNMTQEFHFRLMESTLLQFGIKTSFSKFYQNKPCMPCKVCHILWKNEDFIDVRDHKIIQLLTKDIIHHMLKDNRCIGKVKGKTTYSKWP